MFVITNREIDTDGGAVTLSTRFQPGAAQLRMVEVGRKNGGGYTVSGSADGIEDAEGVSRLSDVFAGPRPVLVYLHGNNNTPQDCFERCLRLQESYDVEVVGFSWPSEGRLASGTDLPGLPAGPDEGGDTAEASFARSGTAPAGEGWVERKKRRYRQAKANALDSVDALARSLRWLAAARLFSGQQPMTVAAHSLGSHLLQHALPVDGFSASLAAAQHVVLLAPCCRAAGHEAWLSQLHPRGRVFVTFHQSDSVLFAARIADRDGDKLGANPGSFLVSPSVRYVDFTGGMGGFLAHTYFVAAGGKKLAKVNRKLFARLFNGQADFSPGQGEGPRTVYPLGCSQDGSACHMGLPPFSEP